MEMGILDSVLIYHKISLLGFFDCLGSMLGGTSVFLVVLFAVLLVIAWFLGWVSNLLVIATVFLGRISMLLASSSLGV